LWTSTPSGAQAIGSGERRSSRSSPTNTEWTSSRASAADVSIERILACASGERTIAAWSVPVIVMSST